MKHIIAVFLLTTSTCFGQGLIYKDTVAFNPDTMSLVDLCDLFQTDKCPDKHGYIYEYAQIFEPVRNKTKRFLEIGILHGASHHMWESYFKNASIYGMDIDTNTLINKGRIHSAIADQGNREELADYLKLFPGKFDAIIDDGGHSMEQQQVSFAYLFSQVQQGGYYIIEDVHTSLPEFYPPQYYGVNADTTNTTLQMLNTFLEFQKIESQYMSEDEITYLENSIDYMQLIYKGNALNSVFCIIRKKEEIE